MSILLGSDRLQSGTHRVVKLVKIMIMATLAGAIVGLAVDSYLGLQRGVSVSQLEIAKSYLLRRYWHMGWGQRAGASVWDNLFLDPDKMLTDRQLARHITLEKASVHWLDYQVVRWWFHHRNEYEDAGEILVGTTISFPVILAIIIFLVGRKSKQENLRRGAQLVPSAKLSKMARKIARERDFFDLAGVKVPGEFWYKHTLFMGTTGAGKSQGMAALLDQIRARGEMVIAYDPGSEFLKRFYEDGDHVLNPLDDRSVKPCIFREFRADWDADAIAHSLIQPSSSNGGNNEFFYEGSRIAFAEALRILKAAYGRVSMDRVRRFLCTTPLENLHEIFLRHGSHAATFFDPKGKAQGPGIQSTLTNKLAAWKYCSDEGDFSVRDYVRNGDGWLFLTSREDQHIALEPLISLFIELAVIELLCRRSGEGKRCWLVIDEGASLQRLPSLIRLAGMGRKFNAAVVFSSLTPSALSGIYGREDAATLMGCLCNRVTYRLEDYENAEAASKFFGAAEVEGKRETSQMGRSMGAGRNLSEDRREERLILPSQIQSIPDLRCYVKLSGGLPATYGKIKFVDRPQVAEEFVPRPPEARQSRKTSLTIEAIQKDIDQSKSADGAVTGAPEIPDQADAEPAAEAPREDPWA